MKKFMSVPTPNPKPKETEIVRSILDYLAFRPDIFCWRNNTGSFVLKGEGGSNRFFRAGLKGSADILGIIRGGRMIAIEVKRPGGKLSDDQSYFLERINKLGGIAFVATSIDDVETMIEGGCLR